MVGELFSMATTITASSRRKGCILAGLTAEPEISVKELKGDRAPGKQLTLLVCSDGVWEFIENPNALGFLKGEGGYDLRKVGDLAQSSWDKWMEDSDNEISDDITVMAVHL